MSILVWSINFVMADTVPEKAKTCADWQDYYTDPKSCNADNNYCGFQGFICTDLTEGIPKSAIGNNNATLVCYYEENGICKVTLSSSGSTGISAWIGFIYKISAVTIGLAAVLMIVWAGFQMSYSGGSKDVGNAKKMIYNAIYAIVLILLSGMILRFVNPDFFK